MPYKSELISKGTISWPEPLESARENLKYGRRSNVLRATSVFFGLYDPRKMVEFGWNPDLIDYTSTYLSRVKNIKKPLLENFRVLEFHPSEKEKRDSKRDFDAVVSSMFDENEEYIVNLGNLPWTVSRYGSATGEDIFNEFLAFLNYQGKCSCGAVTKKGSYCSMPEDYFMDWYDGPVGEYGRILSQPDERKPYGNLICKHQAKVLVESGRFPHVFNKMRFYHFFPDMLKALRLNYRKNLRIKDLDEALLPSIKEMSFGLVADYIKERANIDKRIEESKNEVIDRLSSVY